MNFEKNEHYFLSAFTGVSVCYFSLLLRLSLDLVANIAQLVLTQVGQLPHIAHQREPKTHLFRTQGTFRR